MCMNARAGRLTKRNRCLCCSLLCLIGCGGDTKSPETKITTQKQAPADSVATTVEKTDPGHSHERGKMLLADAGKHHALLTAHLSPKGNELDLFFETSEDKNPTPVALAVKSIKGFATRPGEEKPQELEFLPAPAEERPKGEKSDACSHFVAKAPWMKPTDALSVTIRLEIDGERHRVTWDEFVPRKYAHHEEK